MGSNDTFDAPACAATSMTTVAVQASLAKLQEAFVQTILLEQRPTINDDVLRAAAERQGAVAQAAAAFINSRNELGRLLRQQIADAQAEVDALVWPYLTQIFGTQLPGKVTCLSDCGSHPIQGRVTGLESLRPHNGDVSGTLRTVSEDGSGRGTRSFFTRDGRIFFVEHMSL